MLLPNLALIRKSTLINISVSDVLFQYSLVDTQDFETSSGVFVPYILVSSHSLLASLPSCGTFSLNSSIFIPPMKGYWLSFYIFELYNTCRDPWHWAVLGDSSFESYLCRFKSLMESSTFLILKSWDIFWVCLFLKDVCTCVFFNPDMKRSRFIYSTVHLCCLSTYKLRTCCSYLQYIKHPSFFEIWV